MTQLNGVRAELLMTHALAVGRPGGQRQGDNVMKHPDSHLLATTVKARAHRQIGVSGKTDKQVH